MVITFPTCITLVLIFPFPTLQTQILNTYYHPLIIMFPEEWSRAQLARGQRQLQQGFQQGPQNRNQNRRNNQDQDLSSLNLIKKLLN